MSAKSVGILGAGWFGCALAQRLASSGKYGTIRVTCTSTEKAGRLREQLGGGVEVIVAAFDPDVPSDCDAAAIDGLFDSEALVVGLPPRVRGAGAGPEAGDQYVEKIRRIAARCERGRVGHLVFVSTTSVYPDSGQLVSEADELPPSPFLLGEQAARSGSGRYATTVLRFSGLMGYDRLLGKYLAGRQGVDGDAVVNFVHRDDCVAVAEYIVDRPHLHGTVYNVTAPVRRTRRQVLDKNVADFGFAPATYTDAPPANYKIVAVDKLLATGYTFIYPDPLNFHYTYSIPSSV